MDNLTTSDHEQPDEDDDDEMTQLMIAITNVSFMIQRNTQKHKLLQYQVNTVKGQEKRYIEFKNLRLNDIRPFQNKITEGEKLQFFLSLLRENAIEFWQTIKVTFDTTLRDILQMFRKEFARDNLKEISRYRRDQLKSDLQNESFSDFLKHLKKTTKQASDLKTNGYVDAFLFGNIPVPIQNDLSVASKQDATADVIRDFTQKRYQC